MTRGFKRLATLQFEIKLQESIRMEITIFRISIWGGISSDIRSEITFYSSSVTKKTKFPTVYPTIYLPKIKFWIQLFPMSLIWQHGVHFCHVLACDLWLWLIMLLLALFSLSYINQINEKMFLLWMAIGGNDALVVSVTIFPAVYWLAKFNVVNTDIEPVCSR